MTEQVTSTEINQRLQALVNGSPTVVFMKGNRTQPQCGFSAQVVQILDRLLEDYETVDVLQNQEIREGVKEFSDWPTIPQLYINGEFQGGCDIVREMYGNGELHRALGKARPEVDAVEIKLSDEAAALLTEAKGQYGGGEVHLGIDARFQHSLAFGPKSNESVTVEANGIDILMDPDSATRANGLVIDVREGPQGKGLLMDNPNAPEQAETEDAGGDSDMVDGVGQMDVKTLSELREQNVDHVLVDVRTAEERETAKIEGALWLEEDREEIEAMDFDRKMIFHCHHGGRSQRVAKAFADAGFTDVHNLSGGINAWSVKIDDTVPRY